MIPLEPGLEFLPGLTLVRRLGRGGMGEAWLALDRERGADVVAKVLPADAPEERVALLRREARLVRKLSHPSIVPVHGFRSGANGSAVILEYLPGGDAGRLRGAPPLPIVRVAREIASALAHLHDLGVVHRDVKPSNVLLDAAGRAHLADFGIAAVAAGDEEGIVLRGGGSRASSSPQQLAGDAPQPADDAYALGALLYELLFGQPPFGPDATDEGIRTLEPPPLATPHPIPPALRALVSALLAKAPDRRPRDMREVGEALRRIEEELAGSALFATPRPEVRLQPPPRPSEAGVVAPLDPALARPIGRATAAPRALAVGQAALLAVLAATAVFVVVVLPRWARPPVGPAAATPSAAPSPSVPSPVPVPPAPEGPSEPPKEPTSVSTAAPPAPRPVATRRPAEEQADERRRGQAFAAALSEAHAALDRREWEASRKALASADALRPGTTAVVDGLRRVEAGERAEALARHRDAGQSLEAREDWRAARAEYQAALRLDPDVAFARGGLERAAARAVLAEQMDFHIANPQRLSTEAVAQEVERLLDRAREVTSPGPRHRAQMEELERRLGEARRTVTVTLESDGLTEVVVSRVGRLGTFTRRALELRPGTYGVIGTRRGYRDVRARLVVNPGQAPPALLIRCEEAI